MKFLSHMRSKSKLKNQNEARSVQTRGLQLHNVGAYDTNKSSKFRPVRTLKLPPPVLRKILTYVCPHAEDNSYVSSDDSMIDAGCMLCDMRDLAQCALVQKDWSEASALLL